MKIKNQFILFLNSGSWLSGQGQKKNSSDTNFQTFWSIERTNRVRNVVRNSVVGVFMNISEFEKNSIFCEIVKIFRNK